MEELLASSSATSMHRPHYCIEQMQGKLRDLITTIM